MQLILETENTSLGLKETMSTFEKDTVVVKNISFNLNTNVAKGNKENNQDKDNIVEQKPFRDEKLTMDEVNGDGDGGPSPVPHKNSEESIKGNEISLTSEVQTNEAKPSSPVPHELSEKSTKEEVSFASEVLDNENKLEVLLASEVLENENKISSSLLDEYSEENKEIIKNNEVSLTSEVQTNEAKSLSPVPHEHSTKITKEEVPFALEVLDKENKLEVPLASKVLENESKISASVQDKYSKENNDISLTSELQINEEKPSTPVLHESSEESTISKEVSLSPEVLQDENKPLYSVLHKYSTKNNEGSEGSETENAKVNELTADENNESQTKNITHDFKTGNEIKGTENVYIDTQSKTNKLGDVSSQIEASVVYEEKTQNCVDKSHLTSTNVENIKDILEDDECSNKAELAPTNVAEVKALSQEDYVCNTENDKIIIKLQDNSVRNANEVVKLSELVEDTDKDLKSQSDLSNDESNQSDSNRETSKADPVTDAIVSEIPTESMDYDDLGESNESDKLVDNSESVPNTNKVPAIETMECDDITTYNESNECNKLMDTSKSNPNTNAVLEIETMDCEDIISLTQAESAESPLTSSSSEIQINADEHSNEETPKRLETEMECDEKSDSEVIHIESILPKQNINSSFENADISVSKYDAKSPNKDESEHQMLNNLQQNKLETTQESNIQTFITDLPAASECRSPKDEKEDNECKAVENKKDDSEFQSAEKKIEDHECDPLGDEKEDNECLTSQDKTEIDQSQSDENKKEDPEYQPNDYKKEDDHCQSVEDIKENDNCRSVNDKKEENECPSVEIKNDENEFPLVEYNKEENECPSVEYKVDENECPIVEYKKDESECPSVQHKKEENECASVEYKKEENLCHSVENKKDENECESVENENIVETITTEIVDQKLEKAQEEDIFVVNDVNASETEKDDTSKQTQSPGKISKNICSPIKLSNNLDILSDDEYEPPKVESKTSQETDDKHCISLDDDDDIMLIDEDITPKNDNMEKKIDDTVSKINEDKTENNFGKSEECPKDETKEPLTCEKESTLEIPKTSTLESTDKPQPKEKSDESEMKKIEKRTPLLPENLFKNYKKNIADMTRDELEEFCILKIVESIIDRSDLNEIRTKLKLMAQNMEEYKKKSMTLMKQNRDLQLVLKSVQEEQKKGGDTLITPLKITRSVGMQVLMTEKITRKKNASGPSPSMNNLNNTTANNRPQRNMNQKLPPPNNNQQIPVPRLVPAPTNTTINRNPNVVQSPSKNAQVKPSSPMPNGVKNSPPPTKPEKRTHSKMLTVDLTDDEPPAKVPATKVTSSPPVRLVPPQNLMVPRQQVAQTVNSPRKVYIPIGAPQGSAVRPGQTIMLKPVSSPGPRQRGPVAPMVRIPQNSVRMGRVHSGRHPAPLPDIVKQYQSPNWKALPPAPDLKLSKVENGIVISWKIEGYLEDSYEEIASYQLYAYQETSAPPNTALWKKIGDVKALPLPMACTLTQFMAGYKYYFAVRAVDVKSRLGPFSLPGSILLLNKM